MDLHARCGGIVRVECQKRLGVAGAEEKGALLIALDLAEGANHVRALREAGTVITESWLSGMPTFGVVVLPRDGSAVSRYFLEQATPFFTIGLTGSIASVLRGVQAGM